MAEWDVQPRYFWGDEMNSHEGDWDFDALDEIDWNTWDEITQLPPADQTPSNIPPNALPPPPSHQRNTSSSSATLGASSPITRWPDSPPMRGPQSPILPPPTSHHLPPLPTSHHMRLGTAATSSRSHREYHPLSPPSQDRLSPIDARSAQLAPTNALGYQIRPQPGVPSFSSSPYPESSTEGEEEVDASFLILPGIFEPTPSSASSERGGDEMPPTTTSRRRANNGAGAVVDLTESSPPPEGSSTRLSRPLKRSAPGDSTTKPKKRARPTPSTAGSSNPSQQPIEEFDLTNETTTAEEEVLRAQQAAEDGDGPLPISKRQCIICLEPFTNVTVTHCGHIYCHECLTQALNVGEKNSQRGVGTCPVCRKPVKRNTKQNQMIVVNFMKKETYGKGKRNTLLYGN